MEVSVDELRQAVEQMHGCRATLREVVPVLEHFRGAVAWEGTVHVFDLANHPSAKACFAWSAPIDGSGRRRFYAVLQMSPVLSASDAVKAALSSDHKSGH